MEAGDNGSHPYPLPNWVDPALIKQGQEFVRQNFFSVFFAHFISLIFLLSYTPVKLTLLKTQETDTSFKSLRRYLSTLLHIKLWYEEDLLTPTGKAAEDAYKIRKIHGAIAKKFHRLGYSIEEENNGHSDPVSSAVEEDMKRGTIDDLPQSIMIDNYNTFKNAPVTKQIFVSQLDMAVTQYAFVGFIVMFPTVFGIWGTENQKGLQGFQHLWAVLGHLLGIEDKFNFCIPNNLDDRKKQRECILYKVILPEMRFCNANTVTLWRSLINGWSLTVPFLSFNGVLLFAIRNVAKFKGETVAAMMNVYDRFCYSFMCVCFKRMDCYMVVAILNFLLRILVGICQTMYIKRYRGSQTIAVTNV